MTPIEKAENALNSRISQLQATLRETQSETAQQFLVQALVVSIGIGEALTHYVRMIGEYAKGRHGELKQTNDALTAQHADLLKEGQALLERLKAAPADAALRKEIEGAQKKMADIQKNLKRGANALQRETAPSIAMIDQLALGVRRLSEAGQIDALQRAIKLILGNAHDLYRAQPTLPARDIIDAATWEKTAASEIAQATDSHEAFARAGYQAMLALDVMAMAVSSTPPRTTAEALQRANESVATRVKAITARFATA